MTTPANAGAIHPEAGAPPVKVALTSILLPVLLSTTLALAAAAGGVFWLVKSGRIGVPSAAGTAGSPAVVVVVPPPSHVLALEPLVVNLADAGGRSYLRAAVSLRLRDEDKATKKVEAPKDPKAVDVTATALRDTTLTVLSSQSADGLLAPDGREALKKRLGEGYRLHNPDTHVLEVYFTEFLVQRA